MGNTLKSRRDMELPDGVVGAHQNDGVRFDDPGDALHEMIATIVEPAASQDIAAHTAGQEGDPAFLILDDTLQEKCGDLGRAVRTLVIPKLRWQRAEGIAVTVAVLTASLVRHDGYRLIRSERG